MAHICAGTTVGWGPDGLPLESPACGSGVPAPPVPENARHLSSGEDNVRHAWVDQLKGLALIWVFLNHASEEIWGGPWIGNPSLAWPPLLERLLQLRPLEGYGIWNGPVNAFRYVGWLGDQGVGLFLIASGFGLAWSLQIRDRSGRGGWSEFYTRRLLRIYPLWWAVHGLVVVHWLLGGDLTGEPLKFLLSLIGFRSTGTMLYAYSPSWWFVGLLIQLYLVFPLLWRGLLRLGSARFLMAIVVTSALARGAGSWFFGDYIDPWLRGSVFVTRLPEFALGMVLARRMHDAPGRTHAWLRSPWVVLCSAGLFLLGTAMSLTWWGMTLAPFVVGLGAFGVLYPVLTRNVKPGWIGWLGLHSYPIYLIHHLLVHRLLGGRHAVTPGVIVRLLAAAALAVVIGIGLEWALGRTEQVLKRRSARTGDPAPHGEAAVSFRDRTRQVVEEHARGA